MLVRLFPVLGAVALCALLVAVSGEPGRAVPGSERLPDLDQEAPRGIEVTGHRLGFVSAVRNVGAGPLIVSGRRERTENPAMTADQLIEQRAGPKGVVEDVGRLRYVRSPDHEHWHLLRFERYELRRPGRKIARRKDRKTGFCLGDRYRARGRHLPARPAKPVYTSRCGLGATGRLRLVEGISVGYGDDYKANLEGQSLPLGGLEAGRYLLVHRVNAGRRLRESDYGNNAASLLLALRWRGGEPRVRVLRSCPHAARCLALPSSRAATRG